MPHHFLYLLIRIIKGQSYAHISNNATFCCVQVCGDKSNDFLDIGAFTVADILLVTNMNNVDKMSLNF